MIGDLFDSPWKVLIVAVVLIVLFGSRKLPDAARSLGRSLRILKSEVQDLHGEDAPATTATAAVAQPAPQQQQIEQLQQQIRDLQGEQAAGTATVGGEPVSQVTRDKQPG
jgi:sec-independent protein translocase protein TatA